MGLLPDEVFKNMFNTSLSPNEENNYQDWLKIQSAISGRNRSNDDIDYDMRGLFKTGGGFADNGHATDQFKKPNHPTFSTGSQYSSGNLIGGEWTETPNGWQFSASPTNSFICGNDNLRKYFLQTEPDAKLKLPEGD